MERLHQEESVVSFDILDMLNESNNQMEEIDANELPDSVLQEILLNENIENESNANEVRPVISLCEDAQPEEKKLQKPRFRYVTKTDVDQIASNSCKKKTHKQTL